MRLDHFFYYSARTAFVERENYRLQDIQLEASSSQLPVSSHEVAASGRIFHWRLGTGNWQPSSLTLSGTIRRRRFNGYAATNPAVCAGSSRAEAPSGAKAGPQAHNFAVVIGEGSHPFPFRTRKLSSLPPMVLHG